MSKTPRLFGIMKTSKTRCFMCKTPLKRANPRNKAICFDCKKIQNKATRLRKKLSTR